MIFYTAKNYKKGVYILNIYKPKDFVIMCVSCVVGGIGIIVSLILNITNIFVYLFLGLVIGVPVFMFLPLPNYHNFYTYIKGFKNFKKSRQSWEWRGIKWGE
ncbi:MAG: hypothetical protein WBO70_00885 [Erysipelotrichaceae bacterium]